MSGRLAGRRIAITGAAAGIGKATAKAFLAAGATLALLDRNVAGLSDLEGCAIGFDAGNPDSVRAAVETAATELGGLDGLVNAAGVFEVAPIGETTLDMWTRMISVNLTGPFLLCQAAIPYLKAARNATIVNLGSASALSPFPGLAAYGASKGGVATFTKVLAAELAPDIRVNLVCPGMTRTRMVSDWHPDEDELAKTAKRTYPLQRIAEPEEIEAAVLFLSSAESSFITGTTLVADGGRTFH